MALASGSDRAKPVELGRGQRVPFTAGGQRFTQTRPLPVGAGPAAVQNWNAQIVFGRDTCPDRLTSPSA
jgi:hypothetical protein